MKQKVQRNNKARSKKSVNISLRQEVEKLKLTIFKPASVGSVLRTQRYGDPVSTRSERKPLETGNSVELGNGE